MTISESFKRFQYFNFETNFLEKENLFQNLFLVEITEVEKTTFPFKTALSQTNVKANRISSTK